MNKKKRICVVLTGGTIGSRAAHGIIELDGGQKTLPSEEYKKRTGSDIEFDARRPLDMLSENVQTGDLDKLASCLREVNFDDYDGVIVTHGTDTLSFTANYLALLLADAPVPVVFVSALYPLADPRTNGYANFAAAVTFIESADYGGVFVAFANPGEPCKIHLAGRLVTATQLVGAYDSLAGVPYGIVEGGKFEHNPDPRNPAENMLKKRDRVPIGQGLCADVVTIRARALLDFSYYRFENRKPRAVVVELYHSGTICTAGEETNFLQFRDYCRGLGIAVVLAPVGSRADVYASARGLGDGCFVAYDTSYEMTLVKVMSALYTGEDIGGLLAKNIFFEKVRL